MSVKLTPETWAQVRYEYEQTAKPVDDICLDHGVSPSTLRDRMRRWRWTRRYEPVSAEGPPPMPPAPQFPAPTLSALPARDGLVENSIGFAAPQAAPHEEAPADPAEIVPRLRGAVARVLPAIEATVGRLAAGPMPTREMERAARTLTALTRTLRELNTLLAQYPAPEEDRGPEDKAAFIQDLADRMNAFAAQYEAQMAETAGTEQKDEERG
jgi:hypothetical protein